MTIQLSEGERVALDGLIAAKHSLSTVWLTVHATHESSRYSVDLNEHLAELSDWCRAIQNELLGSMDRH